MAITAVPSQQATASPSSSAVANLTQAFPNNVTSQSLLVVIGAVNNTPAPAAVVVTDTVSTSYTVYSGLRGAIDRVFIAIGIAPSSGANIVTVDPTGLAYISFGIDEFAGTSITLDTDNGLTTGTSNTPSTSITTGATGALILGVMNRAGGTGVITTGSGYFQIGEEEDGTLFTVYNAEYKIAGAPGSVTVDWGLNGSLAWGIYAISVKEGAADPVFWRMTDIYR